eukprot:CAMPEP_0180137400 /NCGR_PEP_ID=MMETSP0986-20121125/12185_1 /TAXON_ID=697907 /ORGANISM="non described non described, Strain CCMP2293" /LENGTH=383 /DNA_ID=CAMNT_0022078845 /DNA_START=110 /DNA_END=1261 /DNA_ORIENTATION=+
MADDAAAGLGGLSLSGVEVSLAVDSKCILGESPAWDRAMKRLHFVDIEGCKILSFDPATNACDEVPMGEKIGCVVPYQQGRLLAAGVEKIYTVDVLAEVPEERKGPTHMAVLPDADCETVEIGQGAQVLQAPPGFRFNDGKCDPSGRLWVGSMNSDWRNPEARKGKLYCMTPPKEWANEEDPDGILHQYGPNALLREKLASTTLSNGMAWARRPGGEHAAEGPFDTFYFIDSALQTIDAFAYCEADGSIDVASRRTVVKVPTLAEGGGVPDGMTLDADGHLWVVLGESGCVVQYDPASGSELRRVKLPVLRPTACTFGGDDLADLYVTTREEKGESASANHGGLFKVRVEGVKGMAPAWHFGSPPDPEYVPPLRTKEKGKGKE